MNKEQQIAYDWARFRHYAPNLSKYINPLVEIIDEHKSEILALKAENERLKVIVSLLEEKAEICETILAEHERLRATVPSCGCQYCLDGIDIIQMKFPNTHECGGTWWKESVRTPKYCPMCGRKLKPEGGEG